VSSALRWIVLFETPITHELREPVKHIYTFLCLFLLSGVAFSDVTGKAYVTDGDTVRIGDIRVRLHGIDAPEQKQKCWKAGQAWSCGRESTKTLNALINNQIITCKGDTTDQYGSLIAVCYLKTTDLNAAIVEAGMIHPFSRKPHIVSNKNC
jgi:endonuclease YncB( thermonuclease family)